MVSKYEILFSMRFRSLFPSEKKAESHDLPSTDAAPKRAAESLKESASPLPSLATKEA